MYVTIKKKKYVKSDHVIKIIFFAVTGIVFTQSTHQDHAD